MRKELAEPSHFKEEFSNCIAHLAHAIAAPTHRDIKAMARAKSSTLLVYLKMDGVRCEKKET